MNCLVNSDEVRMWAYEETLPSGEILINVINQTHSFCINYYWIILDMCQCRV